MKHTFFLVAALLFFSIVQAQNIPRTDPNAANLPVEVKNNVMALVSTTIPSVTIINEPCSPPDFKYNHTWMKKNLNVTTYRNGDPIPEVKDPVEWSKLTTGAWCYQSNDPATGKIYGKLYNWYAVNDPRGLAPEGWHVPTEAEWTALQNCLCGVWVAGGKMKAWGKSTNSSGWAGLPGGYREYINGSFNGAGEIGGMGAGYWWSSTVGDMVSGPWNLKLETDYPTFYMDVNDKGTGFSVRCIKD